MRSSLARALGRLWLLLVLLAPPAAGAAAEELQFKLVLHEGALQDESQKTLRVVEGDHLTLEFLSDRPATLHLHAYDLELELRAGEVGTMAFVAAIAGRFPLEAHQDQQGHGHGHGPLLYLEVYPD